MKINNSSPAYFIADIAANHDGSLDRALSLIELAAKAGANAAKFQNFLAETIVSKRGFEELGKKLTHQSTWSKSVVEVYKDAELPIEWTDALIAKCKEMGIDYFTAPYDLNYVDYFSEKMPYFKVGSGDITWKESLERICSYGKPVFLATGASTMDEVVDAVRLIESFGNEYVLMQCNTNYTGSEENLKYLNIKVLEQFKSEFPNAVLGLSDHSQGHISVLAAVALGAKAIEKHFTDDTNRPGPDHAFSLDPQAWKEMVENTRLMEICLGDGIKKVEENEIDARIVQRRALRFRSNLKSGTLIEKEHLIAIRPAPQNSISPFDVDFVVGKKLRRDVIADQLVLDSDIEQ